MALQARFLESFLVGGRVPSAPRREVKIMKYCPDCGGELDGEGVCPDCGFDTTEDLKENENDDENQDWEED